MKPCQRNRTKQKIPRPAQPERDFIFLASFRNHLISRKRCQGKISPSRRSLIGRNRAGIAKGALHNG